MESSSTSSRSSTSPAQPNPGDPPILDGDMIRLNLGALGDDAAECLSFLTETFAEDTPGLLANMRKGAEENDRDLLRMNAHTLKSSSATLGAMLLSHLCLQLEVKAKAGDLAGSVELVAQAEQAYEEAKVGLQNFQW